MKAGGYTLHSSQFFPFSHLFPFKHSSLFHFSPFSHLFPFKQQESHLSLFLKPTASHFQFSSPPTSTFTFTTLSDQANISKLSPTFTTLTDQSNISKLFPNFTPLSDQSNISKLFTLFLSICILYLNCHGQMISAFVLSYKYMIKTSG